LEINAFHRSQGNHVYYSGQYKKSFPDRTLRAEIASTSPVGKSPPAKELHMLAKCANPSCFTPLVYLREGKIFMVESPQSLTDKDGAIFIRPKAPNRVEHFWLCGPCSLEMTLTYDRERGVEVVRKAVRKSSSSFRAAAS
jgi:hypothetical protein